MSDDFLYDHYLNNAINKSIKDVYHDLLEGHYEKRLNSKQDNHLKILYHYYSRKPLWFNIDKESKSSFEGMIFGFKGILLKSFSFIPHIFEPNNGALLVEIIQLNLKYKSIVLSRKNCFDLDIDFDPKVTFNENTSREEFDIIEKSKKYFKVYDLTKYEPFDLSPSYEDLVMQSIRDGNDQYGI